LKADEFTSISPAYEPPQHFYPERNSPESGWENDQAGPASDLE
jgi:hypothetical protein